MKGFFGDFQVAVSVPANFLIQYHPTDHCTVLEPRSPSIGAFYEVQKRRSTDLEASKLWKGRSGNQVPDRHVQPIWSFQNRRSPFLDNKKFVNALDLLTHRSGRSSWLLNQLIPVLPGRAFHNFVASKSVDRRILCSLEMLVDDFWGFGIVKCSAGWVVWEAAIPRTKNNRKGVRSKDIWYFLQS